MTAPKPSDRKDLSEKPKFAMALFPFGEERLDTLATVTGPDLAPLLGGRDAIPDWESRRASLQERWLRLLGPTPERCDLNPETLRDESEGEITRLLIQYETEPGRRVEAYLLLPSERTGPVPGAMVFHGTSSNHILQPAGLADAPTRHLGLHLARRGYAVLCPRCFIFGNKEDDWASSDFNRPRNAKDFTAAAERLLGKHPNWSGMGKMLWDGMRAVDYLVSRPEVDASRIIAVGHSLGAKQTLYLAAFDERIRAGAFSEGGIGLPLSNWDAPWYLGDRISAPGFPRDHHELLGLIAPRPFLVIGGGHSDGVKSRPWLDAAEPVYKLTHKSDQLALLIHNAGHDIPDPVRVAAFDWLERAIGRG